jgi:hypothetical protein
MEQKTRVFFDLNDVQEFHLCTLNSESPSELVGLPCLVPPKEDVPAGQEGGGEGAATPTLAPVGQGGEQARILLLLLSLLANTHTKIRLIKSFFCVLLIFIDHWYIFLIHRLTSELYTDTAFSIHR